MSNNERILAEEHILQCQEAFTVFDPNNKGLVATKDLGNLLRVLGINPTNEELQARENCLIFDSLCYALIWHPMYIAINIWLSKIGSMTTWPDIILYLTIVGFQTLVLMLEMERLSITYIVYVLLKFGFLSSFDLVKGNVWILIRELSVFTGCKSMSPLSQVKQHPWYQFAKLKHLSLGLAKTAKLKNCVKSNIFLLLKIMDPIKYSFFFIQDLTIQIDPNVTGYLKLPGQAGNMSD